MFKWLQSFFKIFQRNHPVPELSEVEQILAERRKRMPFLDSGYFEGDNHIMCIGPGWKLSNQTNKAIAQNLATEIPVTHPAIID